MSHEPLYRWRSPMTRKELYEWAFATMSLRAHLRGSVMRLRAEATLDLFQENEDLKRELDKFKKDALPATKTSGHPDTLVGQRQVPQ